MIRSRKTCRSLIFMSVWIMMASSVFSVFVRRRRRAIRRFQRENWRISDNYWFGFLAVAVIRKRLSFTARIRICGIWTKYCGVKRLVEQCCEAPRWITRSYWQIRPRIACGRRCSTQRVSYRPLAASFLKLMKVRKIFFAPLARWLNLQKSYIRNLKPNVSPAHRA